MPAATDEVCREIFCDRNGGVDRCPSETQHQFITGTLLEAGVRQVFELNLAITPTEAN